MVLATLAMAVFPFLQVFQLLIESAPNSIAAPLPLQSLKLRSYCCIWAAVSLRCYWHTASSHAIALVGLTTPMTASDYPLVMVSLHSGSHEHSADPPTSDTLLRRNALALPPVAKSFWSSGLRSTVV